MVKKLKNFTRILTVAFCCLILAVSVMPMKADAVGNAFYSNDIVTKARPLLAGDVLVKTTKTGTEIGALTGSWNLIEMGYFTEGEQIGSWEGVSENLNDNGDMLVDVASKGVYQGSVTHANGSVGEFFRLEERIGVGDHNGNLLKIQDAYLSFEPYVGTWDLNTLNSLIWLSGDVDSLWFECDATIWFVVDGELRSDSFHSEGTTSGVQGVLFWRLLVEMQNNNGIKTGSPIMITDFDIHVTGIGYEPISLLKISRLSDLAGDIFPGDGEWPMQYEWPIGAGGANSFLTYVSDYTGNVGSGGVVVPPSSSGGDTSATLLTTTFTEFLIDAASGFFDAELIPGISMGAIFITVLIMAVVVGVIKLFL